MGEVEDFLSVVSCDVVTEEDCDFFLFGLEDRTRDSSSRGVVVTLPSSI